MSVLQLDLQSVFNLLFVDLSCNRFVKIKIQKYMGMCTFLDGIIYESSFILYNAKVISDMGQCPTKSLSWGLNVITIKSVHYTKQHIFT